MAIDRKAQNDLEETRWREAHEIQALRDMIGVYRGGAAALAAQLADLRAETERLRGALRDARVQRGSQLIEVEIDLDEDAQDLVGVILAAELADLKARELEDVLLVARELTAGTVQRCDATGQAMLRVEHAPSSVRVEIQELDSHPNPVRLNIVERLSERWGTEQAPSGDSRARRHAASALSRVGRTWLIVTT